MTRMDKGVKQRWVQALRSGKYKQTTCGSLTEEDCFCVLGVLCDVVKEDVGLEWKDGKFGGVQHYIPTQVEYHARLPSFVMLTFAGELQPITRLNDIAELPFNQLARLIEQQL